MVKTYRKMHYSKVGEKTLVIAKTIYHRWYWRNVSVEYWAWSQWLHDVRRGSARWLGLQVRILLGAWMSVMLVVCCQRGPT